MCAANKGLITPPEAAFFYVFFPAPSVNDAIAGKQVASSQEEKQHTLCSLCRRFNSVRFAEREGN